MPFNCRRGKYFLAKLTDYLMLIYDVKPELQVLQPGSRIAAVMRALTFHQCVSGSTVGLGDMRRLSLLVLYSALSGFSLSTPVFPSLKHQYMIGFELI